MLIVIVIAVNKTFFFMRIFDSFSPIVTMLQVVTKDLLNFLFFFVILMLGFSLQIIVLALGNRAIDGAFKYYNMPWYEGKEGFEYSESYAGSEFKKIGLFFGNFLFIFRAAMGDFSVYGASIFLAPTQNFLFWVLFFIVLIATNIVFLNFVIAEAGNSYNRVKTSLKEFNLKESA
jgi:hypothetical protein